MPSKGRDRRGWGPGGGSDGFEEDPSDYLRDPELWIDRLPQPFRTIDELLQELLASAWEAIEEREVARQLEQARVHIPEVSDARLLANVEVRGAAPNSLLADSALTVAPIQLQTHRQNMHHPYFTQQ